MKLHSMQFKFLTTIISAMLAITIFVGGLCIYKVDSLVQQQTENIVNVTCEKEAAQMNDLFGDMEKSVNIMASYILDFFSSKDDVKNHEIQNRVIEYADEMFVDVAKCTSGAIAYYMRFAPELSDSKTGLFYSKMNGGDEYISIEPTDLSLYDKDDVEHVGWYWQPYEAKKPIWMSPYYNQNNNILMISYVMPLYYEDLFIGVVGMDFDYKVLTDKVHEIKIYENGFAHLELNGVIMHSNPHEAELHADDAAEDYLHISEKLVNGMTLVLSASYDDIWKIRYDMALNILVTTLVLAAVFALIAIYMVKKIVQPLKKLTDASRKLANGDYDVEIVDSDTYEIKLLSTAFESMTVHLREHKKLQYLLAYRDSLTGLRNTTAYNAWVADFNKEIQIKNLDFGAVVFDANCLKETNDKYGHDMGNNLIIAAARLISNTFKRSPVFRIGGDEFIAILQNKDLEDREELFKKFDSECANKFIVANGQNIPVSIARGFAKYNPYTDTQFVDVFNRADAAMYRHKERMKASRS